MAVVAAPSPCGSSSLLVRVLLLVAVFLLGYNAGRAHYSFTSYLSLLPAPAQRVSTSPLPSELPWRAPPPAAPREIFLERSAVKIEGIGAVLSGLKPILLLAQVTGAQISMYDNYTGHGYNMSDYLYLRPPLPDSVRVPCNVSFNVRRLLVSIVEECETFDESFVRHLHLFEGCNSISVSKYIAHPRKCLKHTQDLVRSFTKFEAPRDVQKQHVCVLRRGGDIEDMIRAGEGNRHAIDEQRTIPVLQQVKRRGKKVVLITETQYEQELRRLYEPNIFSNGDDMPTVVSLLEQCRCTFVSSGSAFAAAMVQITRPTYVVYTSSRPGFSFESQWYHFHEYGRFAVDVNSDPPSIVNRCAPKAK